LRELNWNQLINNWIAMKDSKRELNLKAIHFTGNMLRDQG